MTLPVHCILVSHNSQRELPLCLSYLENQTLPPVTVTIVDSGSISTEYLDILSSPLNVHIIRETNVGYARGNNIGLNSLQLRGNDIVVFLNPDTFLAEDFLQSIEKVFVENAHIVIAGGKLLGYDLAGKKPTGLFDSAGVFRTWYGRWYDRGQGEKDRGQFDSPVSVPALCGALICCRIDRMPEVSPSIFDEDFFMYKEDIELGIRLRTMGVALHYLPHLVAFHCRGWDKKRKAISYNMRLLSSRNEVLLYQKHPSLYMGWALLKYLLVRCFHI